MIEPLEPLELTPQWIEGIRRIAPREPTAPVRGKRRVLLFSLCPGSAHWVIPHTSAVIQVLGEESGAFETEESLDPAIMVPDELARFDAIIMNNTCPARRPKRDLFVDVIQDEARAAALRSNLAEFVARGGGLVGIHAGIIAFNDSPRWEELLGATFDYHPPQQMVTITAVDPSHPLVAALGGQPFSHVDEPYIFRNAFTERRYRPLLVMNTGALTPRENSPTPLPDTSDVAWVKRYGQGRVFFCSPSHNAQSFQNPRLLRFVLDGIQYALGDLPCDDTPIK